MRSEAADIATDIIVMAAYSRPAGYTEHVLGGVTRLSLSSRDRGRADGALARPALRRMSTLKTEV